MQRDLVVRAKAGDREAFTTLAVAAFDRLERLARLILRDDERASDAAQEALISAWRHVRAVRDPDRFDAWLNRLVVRACYQEARRSRRRDLVEIHLDPVPGPAVNDSAVAIADRDQLERAFRRLTPEHRAALVVHHYLDLAEAEAAEALDIPIGTYKSRLNRATAAMRAAFEAEERLTVLHGETPA